MSLCILFHLFAVSLWLSPDGSLLKTDLYPFANWYMTGVGVWQYWNMFSPDPSNLNLYVYAQIWDAGDSEPHTFEIPRMDKIDYVSKYEQERFRKFIENVHNDDHNRYWLQMAQWIAAQDAKKTGKTPVRMQLWRRWWFVPGWQPGMSAPLDNWQQFKFYETRLVDGKPVDNPTIGPPL